MWSAIYKRDFLEHYAVKFLETPGASYQDVSFTFKVFALADRVVLSDKAYIMYRKDNDNSSVKNLSKVYCICDEYKELDKFLDVNPDLKKCFLDIKNINQFNSYMWNTIRIDDKYKLDFVKEFSRCFKEKNEAGEISDKFFKRISKRTYMLLIDNPEEFVRTINKEIIKDRLREIRKNLISIKLSNSGLDIIIFGKQVIGI